MMEENDILWFASVRLVWRHFSVAVARVDDDANEKLWRKFFAMHQVFGGAKDVPSVSILKLFNHSSKLVSIVGSSPLL